MSTRRLVVEVVGNADGLSRTFRGASADSTKLGGSLGKLSVGFGQLIKGTLVVDGFQRALGGLEAAARLGIGEFEAQTKVVGQTAAVLKSTGGVANVTAKNIDGLALSLSNLSGMTKPAIEGAENTLLAFQNVRNFAGKGNDIFDEATKAAVDFSARTGKSLQTSAMAIGRALQDPTKAAGSLRRAYVVLTSAEQAAINEALKHHDVLAAQRDIVGDLEKRYSGAAQALGETVPGELDKLQNALSEIAGQIIGKNVTGTESLLAVGVKWIQNAGNQKKVADDVQLALHDLGVAMKDLKSDFDAVEPPVKRAVDALGGLKNVLETLVALKVASKLASFANALGAIGVSATASAAKTTAAATVIEADTAAIGASSVAAAGEVGGLRVALLGLGAPEVLAGIAAVGAALEASSLTQKLSDKVFGNTGVVNVGKTSFGQQISFKGGKFIAGSGPTSQGFKVGGTITEDEAAKLLGISKAQLEKQLGVPPKGTTIVMDTGTLSAKFPKVDFGKGLPQPPTLPAGKTGGLTAAQKNQFFDNAISSDLTRAGLQMNIKSQISALQTIAGLISARLAATKDVTRRRTLEDQLLQVQSQISGDRAQVASDFLSSLQFGVTKAQATETFKDDIPAFLALENGIKAQIKATGSTLDLQQQLFDAVQGLSSAKSSALSAKDFKLLGLGPTGDALVPGKDHLKKLLASVTDSISGTSLDTSKVQSQLKVIRKELTDSLVPTDVRSKMQELLANLEQQLKDHTGTVQKFAKVNADSILNSIPGLTAAQKKLLRSSIDQIGPGGTVPSGRSAAFARAGAGSSGGLTITGGIHLHGVQNPKQLEAELIKIKARRSSQRGGPYAGTH